MCSREKNHSNAKELFSVRTNALVANSSSQVEVICSNEVADSRTLTGNPYHMSQMLTRNTYSNYSRGDVKRRSFRTVSPNKVGTIDHKKRANYACVLAFDHLEIIAKTPSFVRSPNLMFISQ